ncbi:MAG: molybdopterin converting factor subunit 1 [Polyangiaceae bacterium]|nr:molybdopterin converting factor subunit 1 [Polyangiaceae bacterium]
MSQSPPPRMIQILFFAGVKDRIGEAELQVSLPEKPTSAGEILKLVEKSRKNFLSPEIRIAINEEFAPFETILQPGDTLAVIPPVTGG